MSDSRRSSRGSSNRANRSAGGGARRAAGVRRSPELKGSSRTRRDGETSAKSASASAATGDGTSKGEGSKGAGKASAGRTSVNARHARPAQAGAKGAGGKRAVAATNFLNYPRAGAKNPWRWLPSLRLVFGAMALMVLAGLGFTAWLYSDTETPGATDFALAQTTRVYFADGETEMGEFSEINRTIIPNDEIPENVKDAVVASEDASFYENRGVSPRGIVRALVNNLQGGDRQGGSTITQQYVERYHTGTVTSIPGKAREAVMALKIDQELSKDEILSRYLNTIYFGRGAYGVQEAARAYFDKDAADLTDEEAALLVAVIPAPSGYDPANDPDRSEQLWNRVIERRVDATGGLTREEADAMEFPETIEPTTSNSMGGTDGYLLSTVRNELISQGFTADEISTGGYEIISTIDPSIQDHTVQAIDDLPERPERNRVGTVTIDPSSGAIRAMYGGPDYVAQGQNDANQSRMQAGSIFKTFTLIAALEDGYPLSSRWDGNGPKSFHGGGWQVNNFNNVNYGRVDLRQATTNSINTAYAELNIEIGPQRTRETAVELGLPEDTPGLNDESSNVLGSASPTVLEMGEVYATIAADGVHRAPYVVETVNNPDGSTAYEREESEDRVLDEAVAINATVALQGPPTSGSARSLNQVMGGRPVAGKTGTSESFRSAWFVGFTPQLVTAVGMFQPGEDGSEERLTPFGGETNITGGTFPTRIWGQIMSNALEGEEFQSFPGEVPLTNQRTVQQPTQAPQPTEEPEPTQEEPEPTEEEPTEEEPTEEEPTEEEPTEEEPTEEEPTEEEPTETEEPPEEEPTEENGGGENGGDNGEAENGDNGDGENDEAGNGNGGDDGGSEEAEEDPEQTEDEDGTDQAAARPGSGRSGAARTGHGAGRRG